MYATDYFQRLADYNTWMNEQLYSVCATLPDAIRKEDKGAFFGSIHGTLNHILLADRLWLSRFLTFSLEFESLRQELYSDFATLSEERQKTDRDIHNWVNSLTDEQLSAPFSFKSLAKARQCTFPLWHNALHFFNHQTHHRGQLTTLLKQSGCDPGTTDLLWLPGAEIEPV